jgi:hypothetical protein
VAHRPGAFGQDARHHGGHIGVGEVAECGVEPSGARPRAGLQQRHELGRAHAQRLGARLRTAARPRHDAGAAGPGGPSARAGRADDHGAHVGVQFGEAVQRVRQSARTGLADHGHVHGGP